MDKIDKGLAWLGLAFGGGLSIAGNVRAASLPGLPADLDAATLDAWRARAEVNPSGTALVIAVAFPVAAVLLVEMFNRWTWMHVALRRAAIGTVALIAALMSWVHLSTVLLWEGNAVVLSGLGPLVPDVIAIVSAVALLSGGKSRTPDTAPDMDTDNGADSLPVDTDTDSEPDTTALDADMDSLDMDSLPPAPVDIVDRTPDTDSLDTFGPNVLTAPDMAEKIPTPRRTVAPDTSGWKVFASAVFDLDVAYSDAEIASKILEAMPGTWNTTEAGRKAISRYRKGRVSA